MVQPFIPLSAALLDARSTCERESVRIGGEGDSLLFVYSLPVVLKILARLPAACIEMNNDTNRREKNYEMSIPFVTKQLNIYFYAFYHPSVFKLSPSNANYTINSEFLF